MALLDTGGGGFHAQDGSAACDFWIPPALRTSARPAEPVGFDFWQPVVRQADSATKETSATDGSEDFWWPVERWPGSGRDPLPGREPAVVLPAFDPELAEPLYRPSFQPPNAETMAARRARWLVQSLDIAEARRRRRMQSYFAELFAAFPSPASFRALMHLASEDADATSLVAGCRFKQAFIETADWQWRRSAAGTLQVPASDPAKALSWARARRLAVNCGGDDPTPYVEVEWLEEWLALPIGDPCYFSYLDYIEDQLRARAAGVWTREWDLGGRPSAIEAAGSGATYGLRSTLGAQLFSAPEPIPPGKELAPILKAIARRNHGNAGSGGRMLC